MTKYFVSTAIALVLGFATPQETEARLYGVFSNENPITNEAVATIVFHNDDNETNYDQIVHIDEEGQISHMEDKELMMQAQVITFLPEFYMFHPTNISGFFKNCTNLERIENMECMNTDMVKDMSFLFAGCTKIKELDISMLNIEKVEKMDHMFQECTSLEHLNMDGINTSKVWDFSYMFDNCSKLVELDLSKFMTEVNEEKRKLACHPNCINMVTNCTSMKKLALSPTLVFAIAEGTGMWDEGERANAFNNIGSNENPCRLYLPSNDVTFMLMGKAEDVWSDKYPNVTDNIFNNIGDDGNSCWSGGTFLKGGFWGFDFYFGDEYELVDANHDNSTSITDIMTTINYVLNPSTEHNLFFFNADMNKDGKLSIADIMNMVDHLLTETKTPPDFSMETVSLAVADECDALLMAVPYNYNINAMQMTVIVPESTILEEAKTNNPNTGVVYKKVATNQYNIIAFNKDATAFSSGDKIKLQFQELPHETEIKNIFFSMTDNTLASMDDMKWNGSKVDGIEKRNANAAVDERYFYPNGSQAPKDAKGVIIHNGRKQFSR